MLGLPAAYSGSLADASRPPGPAAANSPTVLARTAREVARDRVGGRGAAGIARRLSRPALRAAGLPVRGVTRSTSIAFAAAGPVREAMLTS